MNRMSLFAGFLQSALQHRRQYCGGGGCEPRVRTKSARRTGRDAGPKVTLGVVHSTMLPLFKQAKKLMLFHELQDDTKSRSDFKTAVTARASSLFSRRDGPSSGSVPFPLGPSTTPHPDSPSVLLSRPRGWPPDGKWYSVYVGVYMPLPYHMNHAWLFPF